MVPVWIYEYMSTCMYEYMPIWVYVCMNGCMYACTYASIILTIKWYDNGEFQSTHPPINDTNSGGIFHSYHKEFFVQAPLDSPHQLSW